MPLQRYGEPQRGGREQGGGGDTGSGVGNEGKNKHQVTFTFGFINKRKEK